VLYAGRWPIMPQSPWNQTMANGRIDIICLGAYSHNGKGNYFDMETKLPNDARGRTHGQKTLDTIQHILTDQGLLSRPVNLAAALTEPEPGFDAPLPDAANVKSPAAVDESSPADVTQDTAASAADPSI